MDSAQEKRGVAALRAYVTGDYAEPEAISAFRGIPVHERVDLLARHRLELQQIDGGRLLILESLLLPFDRRTA